MADSLTRVRMPTLSSLLTHRLSSRQPVVLPVTTQMASWQPWWRHQMETVSALLALCAGNSLVTGVFPAQRPVTRSFDVFFDLRLNKWLSKQSWGWWYETQSRSFWGHYNVFRGLDDVILNVRRDCTKIAVTLKFQRIRVTHVFPPPPPPPRPGTNCRDMCIRLQWFLFKNMFLKMSSENINPFVQASMY